MANVKSIITNSQGNVLINTETDNGYRLNISGNTYTSGDLVAGGYGFFNGEGLGTSVRVGGIYGDLGLYVPSTYDMQFDLGWSGSFKFTYSNVDKFRIDSSGFLYNNSGYLAYGDGTFTNLYAPDANGGITMGDATGPINVYYNDTHTFQSAGQLVNYGGFTSTGFGVGTVAPSSKLEVVKQGNASGGTMLLSGSKTNNATKYGIIATTQYASDAETEGVGLIGGVNTSTDNAVVIGGGIDEINTATVIRFFTAANTTTRGSANEKMRIASDGNVGIGTATPSSYMSGTYGLSVYKDNYPGVGWANSSSYWLWYMTGSTLRMWNSTAGDVLTSNTTGNVLIGTASDNGNKLRVQGTAWISGNVFTNGEQGIELGWTGSTINDQRIGRIRPISTPAQNPYAGGLAFDYYKYDGASYNWFEGMRLNGSGNLLIGTSTDGGYRLDVNGNTRIQGNSYVTSRNYISLEGNLPIAYKIPYSQLAGGTVVSDNLANGGSAKVAYSTDTPGTFFFGPYSSIEPGSYVAKFRLKVASNASSSSIGTIDVAGTNIAANSLLLRPSMFPTSGDYYYFSVPFTVGPAASGSVETRWLNWPGGVTDAYVDHVFIESAQSEAEVYVPTSKDFNVYTDGTSKLVVKNNGNVGIGTPSPSYKLQVIGEGGGLYVIGANSAPYTQTIAKFVYGGNNNSINIENQAGKASFQARDNSDAGMSLILNAVAGNVLIGTGTDVGAKLYVDGSVRASSSLISGGLLEFTGAWSASPYNGSAWVRPPAGVGVFLVNNAITRWAGFKPNDDFVVNSDNLLVQSSTGNVGIGTASPFSKLQVGGNTFSGANGMYADNRVGISNHGNLTGLMLASIYNDATYPEYGLVFVQGATTSDYNVWSLSPDGPAKGSGLNFIYGYNASNIHVGAPVMRLVGGTANVLIGTTTDAGYKLRVNGNSYFDGEAWFRQNAGSGSAFRWGDLGTAVSVDTMLCHNQLWNGSGWTILNSGIGTGYINLGQTSASPSIEFGTGPANTAATTKMIITNAGRVGIGTTNPTMYGGSGMEVASSSSGQVGIRVSNSGTGKVEIGADTSGGYIQTAVAGNNLSLFTGNANPLVMRLSSAGNVIIGSTTDAGYKIDVNGTARVSDTLFVNTTLNKGKLNITGYDNGGINIIDQRTSSGSGVLFYSSITFRDYYDSVVSASIDFYHNQYFGPGVNRLGFSFEGSERLTILRGGNVGIGTTAPDSLTHIVGSTAGDGGSFNGSGSILHVKQNTGWSGAQPWALFVEGYSYLNGFRINAADGIRALYKTASGGQLGFATAGDDPITFAQNAGDYRLYIATGGNLIVGSSTDAGYKLDVHGEILGRDDIRILNTYALILNGTDPNWRIGRNTITDSGWLTSNTLQVVVFGGSTGQGFQVVNTNGTALFEIDGVAGASRFTNALGVGVNPSGTAGRIDASNDIVAYSTSDQRLKENITPIANALDKVKVLTGVEFDWKEETKDVHGYEGHDVGVIAQEVQAVLPEAVRTNANGYLSVRYEKMIALLVEANKELASRVEELEKKLK